MYAKKGTELSGKDAHSGKRRDKKTKRLTFKSCISVVLSVVLVCTSLNQAQAEEVTGKIPAAEGAEEIEFVKDSNGAIVLSEFEPLTETEAYITLEEKGTLADVLSRLPSALKAYADAYVSETEEDTTEEMTTETETETESEELSTEEKATETQTGSESDSTEETETQTGSESLPTEEITSEPEGSSEGETQSEPEGSSEGETQSEPEGSSEGETQSESEAPSEGETQSGSEGSSEGETPSGSEAPSVTESPSEPEGSSEGETQSGSEEESAQVMTKAALLMAVDKSSTQGIMMTTNTVSLRRILSETQAIPVQEITESAPAADTPSGSEPSSTPDTPSGSEPSSTPDTPSGSEPSSETEVETETETGTEVETELGTETGTEVEIETETGTEAETETETGTEDVDGIGDEEVVRQELMVPVTWECSEDYDNTDLKTYTFKAVWDSAVYCYEEELAPTIQVKVTRRKAGGVLVSTQEELAEALAQGEPKILLETDISLTTTLKVPAFADTALDGQGFSLRRGADESGTFTGPMIYLGGEDYTADNYGMLTLSNIHIDGQSPDGHADASAIIDYGSLIMDEGAVVENNSNYGSYSADGIEAAANAYGGGIQVYRQLIISPDAFVTGNYANELGGGVYLANGSELYLYADVITGNSVSETGYGADLYAADGSTIYYDSSVDMKREGFYICAGAVLICMQAAIADGPVDGNVEVYVSVAKDSGYTDEQIAELKSKLAEAGYTLLTQKKHDIDTTDLRNWYVYDHYDTALWNSTYAQPSAEWQTAYAAYLRRPYYGFHETNVYNPRNGKKADNIADWLKRKDEYTVGQMYLTYFKEHIYSRDEGGKPVMTFAGYGTTPCVDFLFYDPESNGEKVVDFDVDSSQVYTHTLAGNGFLVNTGIADDKLYGYLVYYTYSGDGANAKAYSVSLYKINGCPVDQLHENTYTLLSSAYASLIDSVSPITNWESEMSIQIIASPKKIEVRQQPLSAGGAGSAAPILSCDLKEDDKEDKADIDDDKDYSGFGPLVAYTSHDCYRASSFTYSNLRMYYTNPEVEEGDMLRPLEEADFTQEGTQKYFINLFGAANMQYNDSATFGQYQEFLKMMQTEGIALITDRDKTPFGDYLGQAVDPDGKPDPESNLFGFAQGADASSLLSVDDLVAKIKSYITDSNKTTTNIEAKLQHNGGTLVDADPNQSIGNIWLKSVTGNDQIRSLNGESFGDGGYAVQIMDNISYYCMKKVPITVKYDILKPDSSGYTPLATIGPYNGSGEGSGGENTGGEGSGGEDSGGDTSEDTGVIALAAVNDAVGMADNILIFRPAPFIVTRDTEEWPEGQYVVRQTIEEKVDAGVHNSSIRGYAYFYLTQKDTPAPIIPDTPAPTVPDTPVITPEAPPEEITVPIPGDAPMEIQEPATVKAVPAVPAPEEESPEPKTGDSLPAIPISVGACTAFMLKLRLWLYEMELGISDEKKNEMLQALFSWARGTTKPRVYMAVGASAVVLTIYHFFKLLNEKRKRMVDKFGK